MRNLWIPMVVFAFATDKQAYIVSERFLSPGDGLFLVQLSCCRQTVRRKAGRGVVSAIEQDATGL